MKLKIRDNSVIIEGYVNAIERFSNPLFSPLGNFIEKIKKGAFTKALNRNKDVKVLLNHDWNKILGGQEAGNLELEEDAIGLKAKCTITDEEVVNKARNGELVGWSFGFSDIEGAVINGFENGMPTRSLTDLNLSEVSILDNTKIPAYDGTLIEARNKEILQYREMQEDSQGLKIDFNNLTYRQKYDLLKETVKNVLGDYCWLEDFNDQFIFVENDADNCKIYRYNYLIQDKEFKIDKDSKVEVIKNYQEIREKIDYSKYENIIKKYKGEK